VFSDYDVLQPDVVYFKGERRHLIDLDHVIRHPPDLCVEVLSPSTEASDRGRKMRMFARYCVPEYWMIDPSQRRVELYRLTHHSYALVLAASGDTLVESPTLAGLIFRADIVFPD
jgi:Uma2 family endonuclease